MGSSVFLEERLAGVQCAKRGIDASNNTFVILTLNFALISSFIIVKSFTRGLQNRAGVQRRTEVEGGVQVLLGQAE